MIGFRWKSATKALMRAVQRANVFQREPAAIVVADALPSSRLADIESRLAFYGPELAQRVRVVPRLPLTEFFSPNPILLAQQAGASSSERGWLQRLRGGLLNIDSEHYRWDGWEWASLTDYLRESGPNVPVVRERFVNRLSALAARGYSKCYLFGTGPSLSRAAEVDCSDGYRVVCNTIVRDPDLWRKLDPHFIVAGDGIYHFGHTAFASAFRRDLAARLAETDTLFLYPAMFDAIVSRELRQHADRLVPIPAGRRKLVHYSLMQHFELASMGNVLNVMLLPVGCTLSRNVMLWGFDGRAPDDKLFWANSNKHTYAEHMGALQAAHPAFFEKSVPRADPEKYVREVHGDVLENCLSAAEAVGWQFTMLHPSYTPTLQKRHVPNAYRESATGVIQDGAEH